MPLIGLSLIIQILFALHVIKTGRDYRWLFLIILAPAIGCIIYFIIEILPGIQHSSTIRKTGKNIVNTIDPNRGVRKSSQDLQLSNNIENSISHAEECIDRQLYQQAIDVLEQNRKGIFADDPKLLLTLARACFYAEHFEQSKNILEELIEKNPDFKSADGHLLYARSLESLQLFDQAKQEYQALVSYYAGPEAACRFGLFLQQQGQDEDAKEQFESVLHAAEHSPRHYRKVNKEWINLAKQKVIKG